MIKQELRSNRSHLKIICSIWLGTCLLGSLPYIFSGYAKNFIQGLFLSVSAFTTTGAVLDKGLDGGIFLYYLLCQWIGGGAILIFLSSLLTSTDGDASKELGSKRPGRTLKEVLSDRHTWLLMCIYVFLTLCMFICMLLCGHNLWDSLLLSHTVCSTGGFTPTSLGGIQASLSGTGVFSCIFMFLSSISFTIYAKLARKDFKAIFQNEELRFQLFMILTSSILISLANGFYFWNKQSLFQIVRDSCFHVISFGSTTGLCNSDISFWPSFSKNLLILLAFCGGASVSTSSGLKMLRVLLVLKSIKNSFIMRIHPKAVISVRIDKKPIPDASCQRASAYFLLYTLIFFMGSFIISFSAPDLETAFFGSASLLNNLGISFGQIGTSCSYAFLDSIGQLTACLLMLLGRLEIFVLLIPFVKEKQ